MKTNLQQYFVLRAQKLQLVSQNFLVLFLRQGEKLTWVCLMKCLVDTPNTDPPPQIHRKCHTLHAGPLFGALVKLAGVCPDWIRNALFV